MILSFSRLQIMVLKKMYITNKCLLSPANVLNTCIRLLVEIETSLIFFFNQKPNQLIMTSLIFFNQYSKNLLFWVLTSSNKSTNVYFPQSWEIFRFISSVIKDGVFGFHEYLHQHRPVSLRQHQHHQHQEDVERGPVPRGVDSVRPKRGQRLQLPHLP